MGELYDDYIEYCEDCKRWHSYSVWSEVDKAGKLFYYVTDGDGDKVIEDSETIPTIPDQMEELKEYYRYVFKTGDDHLNYIAKEKKLERKTRWLVTFTQWIGQSKYGLRMVKARRAHRRTLSVNEIPGYVVDACSSEREGNSVFIPDAKNTDQLKDLAEHAPKEFKCRYTTNRGRPAVHLTITEPYTKRYARRIIEKEARRRLLQLV